MFLKRPGLSSTEGTALSPLACGLSWTAFVLDVIAVVYVIKMGAWLDTASPLLSMLTLGGHHQIVLGLAAGGLLLLTVLAPLTHGFVHAGRVQLVLLPVAVAMSLAALAGLLSIVALGVGAVVVAAVLFRPRPGIDITHRRR